MSENSEAKLLGILSTTFKVPVQDIGEDFSIDSVESWDSLAHLNLVLRLEHEFNISMSEDETVEIISLALIKLVLKDHGVPIS